jgi:hypothetical protein
VDENPLDLSWAKHEANQRSVVVVKIFLNNGGTV